MPNKSRSNIPSTGRKSNFQANQIGFTSTQDFANSLPKNAIVADVGAGFSTLGDEVTNLRSDVTWFNIDPCYPKNRVSSNQRLHFISTDIFNSDEVEALHGEVDLVYSYWLLPHLALENNGIASAAILSMKSLLSNDGILVVGPIRRFGFGLFSFIRYKGTIKYQKSELNDDTIDLIVGQTKLWWLPRKIQLLSNRYNIHLAKFFVGGKRRNI